MRAFVGLGFLLLACGGSSDAGLGKSKTEDAGGDGAAGASASGGSGGNAGSAGASGAGGTAGSSGTGGSAGAAIDAGTDAPIGTCNVAPKAPGTSNFTVTSSGDQRTARLVIPQSYDASKPVPLILIFHGYTETASQIENISEMTPLAEQHGFVVAYPQGISNAWNAGKCCGSASSLDRPDVQFVGDLIDALESELCIDPKRIYAAGFSNGGMLSNRLACELSDRIAAFGPVAGPRAIDQCNPSRPISMIQFHGTSDFVVPYNGGGLGGAVSAPDNFASWAQNAGCTDPSPSQVYQNGDSTCVEYTSCNAGAAVRFCTVDGGGHQWPGGTSAGPAGKLTQDIDASAEMVAFFLAHPLP